MKVPDRIYVQLISDVDEDLHDLIVEIAVFTGQRNPRRIHLAKSDQDGRTTLMREDFVGQFNDATESDLMGSWGSLDDALPLVEVSLHDTSYAIKAGKRTWALSEHERTKWATPAVEHAYRISSRNREFRADPVKADLHEVSTIVLRVKRVAPSTG